MYPKQRKQESITVYEVLPLFTRLSIFDMEKQFPEFCRQLFFFALESISLFEIDENGELNEASRAIGFSLTEAVHSVTDAKDHFEEEWYKYLDTWIEAIFIVLMPDYKIGLRRLFKHLENDLSEDQLQFIKVLDLFHPRARKPLAEEEEEIENLKALCQSSGAAARMVIDAMARMSVAPKSSQRILLIWSVLNFPAAVLAISIYFEALAFAAQSQKKRTPSDTKWPLLIVYLWRKLGLENHLPDIEARLRYGKGFSGSGSLYKRAMEAFRESNPVDQEIAADAYCDAFIHILNKLPHEALLNPRLAISYLSKSSRRAASRKLPRQKIKRADLDSLVSIYESPEMVALDESDSGSAEEQKLLPEEIRSLPDFELFKQRTINRRSLAELGKYLGLTGRDRSISKQAVHKRLSVFTKRKLSVLNKASTNIPKRLSDEEWKCIRPLLPIPEPKSKRGGRRKDNRRIMGLVLYKMRTGCPWNDLPKGRTLLARYNEWNNAGVFERMKRSGILKELGISSLPPSRKTSNRFT